MAELATIARPYAEAAYQVAKQFNVNAWGEQLEAFARITSDPALRQFAAAPQAQPAQVFEIIAAALTVPLTQGIDGLLRTLIDNGRLTALPQVAEQFHRLLNADTGISEATVYSAFPLEVAPLSELQTILEKRFGRKLVLSVVVQPELIGGVRVVVGDEVLDTSVKARLAQMKTALIAA
jgi:F-type H+-transporting ATPase subunit delta